MKTVVRKQIVEEHVRVFMRGLERLRDERGVFIASPTEDYTACWIRDQLYSTLAYFYTNEHDKFVQGIQVVFDILHTSRERIEACIQRIPSAGHEFIHAKYHPETLAELTNEWGHHQIDAIGLFLFLSACAHRRGVSVFRSDADRDMLQLLVQYLIAIRYWGSADNGMWEEGMDLHASSLGAAVGALEMLQEEKLAVVPRSVIAAGREALFSLLPNETANRTEDMAQLSLLWPYGIVPREIADVLLRRIESRLVQSKGLNRYWDDNYFRSDNGISGEWTMGFFWLAIIYSERGERDKAVYWYERGIATATSDGEIPELYQNGEPNMHTPLGWAHALAIIAGTMVRGAAK